MLTVYHHQVLIASVEYTSLGQIAAALALSNYNVNIRFELNDLPITNDLDLVELFGPSTIADIPADKVKNYKSTIQKYNWWLELHSGYYTRISYEDTSFVDGFVATCKLLNVDFRIFSYGAPYTIENSRIINYTIPGYDMRAFDPRRTPVAMNEAGYYATVHTGGSIDYF